MKLPATLEKSFARFDAMSLRERALLALAMLVGVLMTWTIAVMDPMTAKSRGLRSEMDTLQVTLLAGAAPSDAESMEHARIEARESELQARLDALNAQLVSRSAGVIPPERMVQVIHDVLSHQRGITLISLRNYPVTALVPAVPTAEGVVPEPAGPYMHRVELIIDARYLDLMRYLQALEALPWHFYWRSLELQTATYPMNRVRIELSTLSLDKSWIGV